MRKKIIYLSVILVLVISVITLSSIYKSKDNKYKKEYNTIPKEMAIMIKEEGATDYTKSTSKDIPKGNYVLNEEKTHCENNGKVTNYDSSSGTVSINVIGSDRCYLYFDYDNSIDFLGIKIPLDTELDSSGTSGTTYIVSNENGYRYEGADPNNYICLDNKEEGACSDSSLLFRIIGLFDEDTSSDGTSSSGTKKLLKIIDTNNYGGRSGKYWNSAGLNNWSTASLKTELNKNYLDTLLGTSNVNSKLSSAIANAKWHLGGANGTSSSNYYYQKITTENLYKAERSPYATSGTLQNLFSGNPSSIYAKVGLMYPSDYGYATVGGSTTNKSSCRAEKIYNWDSSSFNDCKNNDWLFTSQVTSWGSNIREWLLTPFGDNSYDASYLGYSGMIGLGGDTSDMNYVNENKFAVRPTFYLDSSLKIVGTGDGTSSNPYRIG